MAGTIRGITIEIEGKTSGLVKSLDQVNKSLKDTQGQLKTVNNALKLDPSNISTIVTKQKLLSTAIKETQEKLNLEKQAAKDAKEALKLGKISENEYNALQAEVSKTSSELKTLKDEAKDNAKNLLTLGQSAKKSGDDAKSASEAWSKFGDAVKRGLEASAKAIAGATAAATAATVALVASAVDGYASIEQLEGGMQKLFGEEDAKIIIANANDAFKTAGMSAEEYMSTATSISASLINALGGDTEAAADMVDVAIRAMSDNASVFGTDLSSIQAAFVGFSRGQFQMLDSLSLGYAGTQEGMIQLINDSGIFEEKISDLSNVDFADMVTAIQKVQENMGIAGNTADEAFGTISGSVNATKSAWQNLINGLADPNADIGQLITNMIDAGMAALHNIQPAIQQALNGIKEALPLVSQVLQENLPTILMDLVPPLVSTVGDLIGVLCESLPGLIEAITSIIPGLINTILDAVLGNIDLLVNCILDLILTIVNTLLDSSNISKVMNAAITILLAIVNGISSALPQLIPVCIEAILTIVKTLLSRIPDILKCGIELILNLGSGLVEGLPDVLKQIPSLITSIIEKFKDLGSQLATKAKEWMADFGKGIVNGIYAFLDDVGNAASAIASKIAEFIHFSRPDKGALRNYEEWMPDFIDGLSKGIDENLYKLQNAAGDMAVTLEGGVNSVDYSSSLNGISNQLAGLANNGQPINVYIGNDRIGSAIARSNSRMALLSGGR